MVNELFDVLLFLFAKILLRIFASMFISDIARSFLFCVLSVSDFGIRVMVTSWNEFEVFLPLQFLKEPWKHRH